MTTAFSSALSVKLRSGQIDLAGRTDALLSLSELSEGDISILPLTGRHFKMAAQFADQHMTGLRGSDALHLAVCSDDGAELCTRDKRLVAAGPLLNVKTLLL